MCVSTDLLYFMSHIHLLHLQLFDILFYQVAPCTSVVGVKLSFLLGLTVRTILRFT